MIINTQKVIAWQIVMEHDNYLEFDFWRCLPQPAHKYNKL